jgi:hypothetical protein
MISVDGTGEAAPLLTGERTMSRGRPRRRHAVARNSWRGARPGFAGAGLDADDIPERELYRGRATGSARRCARRARQARALALTGGCSTCRRKQSNAIRWRISPLVVWRFTAAADRSRQDQCIEVTTRQ